MKKNIFRLVLLLVVASGLVFSFAPFTKGAEANSGNKNETTKTLSAAEKKAALKKWEASPDGIMYKKWEVSPAGKKVYSAEAKILKSIKEYTNMEGIVTSTLLPKGSRLGFGIMIKINDDEYILSFGPEKSNDNEFEKLHGLKVGDKIILKSHSVSHAPKYSYPILSGDYVELDGKIIYKRVPSKDGC